jgi:hypothetical protein
MIVGLSDVSLAELPHVDTTCNHELATCLRCEQCAKGGKRAVGDIAAVGARATAHPGGAMMPARTRRPTDNRQGTWEIWYGDVQVGTIARRVGSEPENIGDLKMVLRFLSAPSRRMRQGRCTRI